MSFTIHTKAYTYGSKSKGNNEGRAAVFLNLTKNGALPNVVKMTVIKTVMKEIYDRNCKSCTKEMAFKDLCIF